MLSRSDLEEQKYILTRSHPWLRCDTLLRLNGQKRDLVKSLTIPKYADHAFTWSHTKEGFSFWADYTHGKLDNVRSDFAKERLTSMINVVDFALAKLYNIDEVVDDSKNIIEF